MKGFNVEMNFSKSLITLILWGFVLTGLWSVPIQIGTGSLLSRSLPVEPVAQYSYSQSIYTAAEVGSGGVISHLGWQYQVGSSIFLDFTNQYSIYLGTTSRQQFTSNTDYLPLDSLSLVFSGNLLPAWFSSPLPGNGWLTLPLDTAYNYSGSGNLVIAVDENMPGYSATSDDFYCHNTAQSVSIEFHSATVNPDPNAPPPANAGNPLSLRPNLRLEIEPVIYLPYNPTPADQANEVARTPELSWQSSAQNWDVYFAETGYPLLQIAAGITQSHFQITDQLDLYTSYQWQIVAHNAGETSPGSIWQFTTIGETLTAPQNLNAIAIGQSVRLSWMRPQSGSVVSYRVYRNDLLIDECLDTLLVDTQVSPNQTYWYYVQAVNYLNQISPPSNSAYISLTGDNTYLLQGFDALPDFSQNLPSWTLIDTDQSLTWQWEEINFPSEGNALSWIVFNPAQTIPPITEVLPVSGSKYLLCPAALNPPNSDWLISPPLQIGSGYHLSFSARSWTADYGLERLRLLISISDSLLSSFSPLSAEPWLSLPANWTTCNYDLSAYAGQRIFLAWQGVSWDAFALCLDEIRITGSVVNQDETQAILSDIVIYPNPAHDQFIVKSISKQPFELTIYNLKGQRLDIHEGLTEYVWTKSTGRNLPTGVYLIKTERSGRHWVQKLVVY